MTSIVSAEYHQEYAALAADPIVQAMAVGLAAVPLDEISWAGYLPSEPRSPKHTFMMAALTEYKARGGTQSKTIGGVATALLRILAQTA